MDRDTPTTSRQYRPWLHRLAAAWVVATFMLVVLGGVVTSKGVGLAVPDWPTTFEHNMFLFPPSMWKGGVFWEHTHRLLGSVVGLLTIGVVCGVSMTQHDRPWLRRLGIASLALVVVQGVVGGLRVTELSTWLAILHGITGQVFLGITVVVTAALSRWWVARPPVPAEGEAGRIDPRTRRGLVRGAWALLAAVVIQLVLGAGVRHTGARHAVPDFPSAYGGWVPPITQKSLDAAIDRLPYEAVSHYYTIGQVWHHYAHRVWAVAVLAVCAHLLYRIGRACRGMPLILRPAAIVLGLMTLQPLLGAAIVLGRGWAHEDEVATAHQAVGAALLATIVLLTLRIHLLYPGRAARHASRRGAPAHAAGLTAPDTSTGAVAL